MCAILSINYEYSSLVDRLLKFYRIHESCYVGLSRLLGLNLYEVYYYPP
jgi:hypothetical protein